MIAFWKVRRSWSTLRFSFQIWTADISLNIARTDLYQPPKWSQFCLDYDPGIYIFRFVLKNDVKRKKSDGFWIKISELSQYTMHHYCLSLMSCLKYNLTGNQELINYSWQNGIHVFNQLNEQATGWVIGLYPGVLYQRIYSV